METQDCRAGNGVGELPDMATSDAKDLSHLVPQPATNGSFEVRSPSDANLSVSTWTIGKT
jgi:hypothetical protein